MKKKYEPPEMYTENIQATFVGACCPAPVNFNPSYLDYSVPACGPPCKWDYVGYGQAG